MAALIAVAWYVFLRLAAAPRLGWYLALGAVFGFGMLAKWNFVLFALALPLACLLGEVSPAGSDLEGSGRRACAAVIALPTLAASWRWARRPAGPASGSRRVRGPRAAALVDGAWGSSRRRSSTPAAPANPLILFGLPFWRGFAAPRASPRLGRSRPLRARPRRLGRPDHRDRPGASLDPGARPRSDGVQGPLFLSGTAHPAGLALHGGRAESRRARAKSLCADMAAIAVLVAGKRAAAAGCSIAASAWTAALPAASRRGLRRRAMTAAARSSPAARAATCASRSPRPESSTRPTR